MENNKTLAFLPKEELLQLQEQSKEQKRSKELAESLKEKLDKAQEVRFSSSDHDLIVKEQKWGSFSQFSFVKMHLSDVRS
jgi:UDP-2,3-diacylglucosamine pyrophosphatase LpxH